MGHIPQALRFGPGNSVPAGSPRDRAKETGEPMKVIQKALLGGLLVFAATLNATIFGSVRGLIHDPQHRPVAGAQVTLRSADSNWSKTVVSDNAGYFHFEAVPLGEFIVPMRMPGCTPQEQRLTLTSGRDAKLHFGLNVAAKGETVQVTETAPGVNPESSTTSNVVSREQIAETPGADRTSSLAMITDYVPGAYVVHDQLHIRGGHQVTWLLDGVPVPNTNIASNVGPQFDPKDIDYLEVQRGGYSAEYGDRTYGVFNVVTRSGFERNRQAEITANYGSYNTTDDEISFGDHTQKSAYFASVGGNRTDLGLETPEADVHHGQNGGVNGFGSVIYNPRTSDQVRFVAAARGDHFQIPNTLADQQAGVRDNENERDVFTNFTWLHTAAKGVVLTFSPFYHYNRA